MRSKALLTANIFATLYMGVLFWAIASVVISLGTFDVLQMFGAIGMLFETLADLLGASVIAATYLSALVVLYCVHIVVFVLGSIVGWVAFAAKKSGGAYFSAVMYLIGTICFPVFLLFTLPITILGFVGGSNQKTINQRVFAAKSASQADEQKV